MLQGSGLPSGPSQAPSWVILPSTESARSTWAEINEAIKPGQSALFVLAEDVKADRVMPMLAQYHPRVLRTSLTAAQEAELKEAFGSANNEVSAPAN